MSRSRFRGLVAAGAIAGLALAFAPALPSSSPAAQRVTAADFGLDFAPQLVKVQATSLAARNAVIDAGLDATEHAGDSFIDVVLHTGADLALLESLGVDFDVKIADLVARESERRALDAAFAEAVEVSDLPSGRTGYRMLDDFAADIDSLVADNPAVAKRISIGKSLEGRDLTGIEIGVDVNEPEDGRPVFLMFGVHHAREWPSAEMPMEFAFDLLAGFAAGDARITRLLEQGRIIIVPVSNPDGYNASRVSGELVDLREVDRGDLVSIAATPGHAYKRKNCRYAPGVTQPLETCMLSVSNLGYGNGVDLNRNYGGLWGGPGASDVPAEATYRGPAPFSEPETQAIRSLISTRQVTTLITNHTSGQMILRPVGVAPSTIGPDGFPAGFAPDECFTGADGADAGMQALGERMAAQNGYSNQFGWELYDTTGTTEDYSYNATGGYGYTFEIGGFEFHPPFEEVVDEYTGEDAAAKAVTLENAASNTTAAGDDCAGDDVAHDEIGGGQRAAYLLAFENAIDAGTHSLLSGEAPAGATLTLQRSGMFPLWDGSPVADTVATSMVVGADGTFDWHVNPSTRPFVASRKARPLGEPRDEYETVGATPASLHFLPDDYEYVVTEDADVLTAVVEAAVTHTDSLAQFHLRLLDPNGQEVASATDFGPINTLAWSGIDGAGVPAGTYTLRVSNAVNAGSAYFLSARTQDVLGDSTPGTFEAWTLSCLTEDGSSRQGVLVARGEALDLGNVCS